MVKRSERSATWGMHQKLRLSFRHPSWRGANCLQPKSKAVGLPKWRVATGKGRYASKEENAAHMQQLPERGVVLGVVRLQRHRRPKRVLSLAQLATPLCLEATLAVAARLVARSPAARPRAVPPYPLLDERCSRRVSQPRVPVGQRPAKSCVAQPTVH